MLHGKQAESVRLAQRLARELSASRAREVSLSRHVQAGRRQIVECAQRPSCGQEVTELRTKEVAEEVVRRSLSNELGRRATRPQSRAVAEASRWAAQLEEERSKWLNEEELKSLRVLGDVRSERTVAAKRYRIGCRGGRLQSSYERPRQRDAVMDELQLAHASAERASSRCGVRQIPRWRLRSRTSRGRGRSTRAGRARVGACTDAKCGAENREREAEQRRRGP